MKKEIEIIKKDQKTIAIIIPADYQAEGVNFFTPREFSQQLAFISHKAGHVISAHIHRVIEREISLTQEVLIIKKGKLKVNFYDQDQKYFNSRVLESGDIILLASGGHGFEVLEDLEMIEVKQGPFSGDQDKINFKGIENHDSSL